MQSRKKIIKKCIFGVLVFVMAMCIPNIVKAAELTAPKVTVEPDTYTSLKVSWEAVEGADYYEVSRSTNAYSGFITIGTMKAAELSKISTSLSPCTTYYYRVRAFCWDGTGSREYGPYSKVVSGIPIIPAPTDVVVKQKLQGLEMSWTEVDNAYGYEIYYSTSPDSNYSRCGFAYDNSYLHNNLVEGAVYYYKVRAAARFENNTIYGEFSEPVFGTPANLSCDYGPLRAPSWVRVNRVSNIKMEVEYDLKLDADEYVTHVLHEIYRSTSPDSGFELIGTHTYHFEGIGYFPMFKGEPGTTYYYKVRQAPCCGVHENPFSPVVKFEMTKYPPLEAPNLTIADVEDGSVELSWNSIDGAEGYKIYRSKSPDSGFELWKTWGADVLACKDLSSNNKKYYYKMFAYYNIDGIGVPSVYSNVVTLKPLLDAPDNVTVSQNSYNSLKVEWTPVEGAEYYELYRSTSSDSGFIDLNYYPSDTLSKISVSLKTGVRYYYKVRAFSIVNGERVYGEYSQVASGIPQFPAPAKVTVTRNSYNSLKIDWSKVDGAHYYRLYRSTSPNSGFVLLGTYNSDTFSRVSKSLQTGTKYYYKVRAYRVVDTERKLGPFSEVVSGTPILTKPVAKAVTGTSKGTVNVTWDKVDGAQYYQVYRRAVGDTKWSLLGVYDENTQLKVSKSLKSGATYEYRVRCYRWANGTRQYSDFSTLVKAKAR